MQSHKFLMSIVLCHTLPFYVGSPSSQRAFRSDVNTTLNGSDPPNQHRAKILRQPTPICVQKVVIQLTPRVRDKVHELGGTRYIIPKIAIASGENSERRWTHGRTRNIL